MGFTFADGGLASVHVPVQVWSGDQDSNVPFASNTRIVQEGLGSLAEPHQLQGASHLSFLAPCRLLQPRPLCTDPAGFDRAAAHAAMNAEIVRYFNAHLPVRDRRHDGSGPAYRPAPSLCRLTDDQ